MSEVVAVAVMGLFAEGVSAGFVASMGILAASMTSVAIGAGASWIIGFAMQALTPKPKAPSLPDMVQGRAFMVRQPEVPQRVLYGECRVSGTIERPQ
jgi:predicted phage tail protein